MSCSVAVLCDLYFVSRNMLELAFFVFLTALGTHRYILLFFFCFNLKCFLGDGLVASSCACFESWTN